MRCKICGKEIKAGKVYNGKAICNECFAGLMGKESKKE